ncbi:hypothetical protein EW146_g3359 [Bondarzewia mesenterica]|uniref:DNA polymerase delta subunit 4 n=1 Tax=Bondarzewia mesenterica TaxID=1095465 RepID=A0A4S4M007_9AGAM|nr:hypothetical protein EW146_g3359 [Bondarzewia mesenterica]
MAPTNPQTKRSHSSGSLKQGKLSFVSAKRTGSASTSGAKGKRKAELPTALRTPSVGAEGPDAESISDSDSEYGLSKRRKVGRVEVASTTTKEKHGVFKPRDGIENAKVTNDTKERESLDLEDKAGRWRKQYGIAREKMGWLEPIHAEGQTSVHHILRVFDLSYEYGPCVGATRLERWERASALGLNPPIEVREILLTKEGSTDDQFSQCVFYGEV